MRRVESGALPRLTTLLLVCFVACSDRAPDPVGDEELLRALGYIASEPAHETAGVVRHDPERAHQAFNL